MNSDDLAKRYKGELCSGVGGGDDRDVTAASTIAN
jgi:hypothetical protein